MDAQTAKGVLILLMSINYPCSGPQWKLVPLDVPCAWMESELQIASKMAPSELAPLGLEAGYL